jgi:hypothetical protein
MWRVYTRWRRQMEAVPLPEITNSSIGDKNLVNTGEHMGLLLESDDDDNF